MPDNGDPPQFVLVVHMAEDEDNDESISSGWVVLRKLQDFQDLHRKLRQLCSDVKTLDLPSQPLKFFGKSDKSTLDKAKMQIQKYLNVRLNATYFLFTNLSSYTRTNIPLFINSCSLSWRMKGLIKAKRCTLFLVQVRNTLKP